MKCSIVLSTKDKPKLLELTLDSIFRQDPPFDTEVIVVNDSNCSEARGVCDKYRSLIQYHCTGSKTYRNPSIARNVGYRAAVGEVIICQCDDVVHITDNVIERLVTELQPGEFLLSKTENWEYANGKPYRYIMDYCSPDKRSVPYFFCGAVRREDLYAVGGNDEDFVEVCYDDNWFADCLKKGRGLKPRHSADILTHHVAHGYPTGSHANEKKSKDLYMQKVREAQKTGVWQSSSGPWPLKREAIPKCMNFFWSSDKMSLLRYSTLKSFRKHHPDWRMRLYTCTTTSENKWTTGEVQDYGTYQGEDFYNRVSELDVEIVSCEPLIQNASPANISDILQWDVLSREGGFYSDMDILYIDRVPYEELKNCDVLVCNSNGFMTIGFIASTPDNPMFRAILNEAISNYRGNSYQDTGAEAIYRLAKVWPKWSAYKDPGDLAIENLKNQFKQLRFKSMRGDLIYPWAWNQIHKLWNETKQVENACIGVHWFGGAKLSQEYNSLINLESVKAMNNTIARLLRNLYEL